MASVIHKGSASMHRPELSLIKDFIEGNFVLFWTEVGTQLRKSPILSSLEDAEEWWLKHHFSLYDGHERRSSIVDRRKHHSERANRERSSRFVGSMPDGRRFTDRDIKVNLDKSRESMLRFLGQ